MTLIDGLEAVYWSLGIILGWLPPALAVAVVMISILVILVGGFAYLSSIADTSPSNGSRATGPGASDRFDREVEEWENNRTRYMLSRFVEGDKTPPYRPPVSRPTSTRR